MDNKILKDLINKAIKDFNLKKGDTGSTVVQIVILSHRIKSISGHLEGKDLPRNNRKDNSAKFGLGKLVAQRKRLLKYLKVKDNESYITILKMLDLRDVVKNK